jgi:intein/homing endonuclease
MVAFNEKHIEELVPKFQKYINIKHKIDRHGGTCSEYRCCNFFWYSIFEQFGKYAWGKYIPRWVLDAPPDLIDNFLRGYEHADGHYREKTQSQSLSTVSINLAYQSHLLYLKIGHIFSLTKFIHPEKGIIEGRIVNKRPSYKVFGRKIPKFNSEAFKTVKYPKTYHISGSSSLIFSVLK